MEFLRSDYLPGCFVEHFNYVSYIIQQKRQLEIMVWFEVCQVALKSINKMVYEALQRSGCN